MQAVLGGKFAQQVICRGVPFRSEKQDDFFQARARASALMECNAPCPAAPRALLPCAPLISGAAPSPCGLQEHPACSSPAAATVSHVQRCC